MKRLMVGLAPLTTLTLPPAAVAQPRGVLIPQDVLSAIARDGETSDIVLLREQPGRARAVRIVGLPWSSFREAIGTIQPISSA